MMETTIKLYSLSFTEQKTYLWATAFVAGNIVLPQLFHLLPQGGMIFLPIYFFTLLGAYKFGWKVGLLTAVLSPLVNSALFGMPAVAVLPAIMLKSVVLALVAGYAAARYHKASLLILAGVVAAYQLLGGLGEWALTGSLQAAMQDIRLGLPGMLLQVAGCWLLLNRALKQ